MGLFKRANWHSGLTYKQECPLCKTTVVYKDDSLGFRPWFPDGFVYCPTCQKPLRHSENYALEERVGKEVYLTKKCKTCSSCGCEIDVNDNFCSKCGCKVNQE